MKLIITLKNDSDFSLPLGYNYQLSSAIYSLASYDKAYSSFLHDEGYAYGTGKHKFFTFSPLNGKHRIENKQIIFEGNISFEIRSISEELISVLRSSALSRGKMRLFDKELEIRMIEVYDKTLTSESVSVRTLSPIAAAKNFDGKTIYYSPEDMEFDKVINLNLYRKFTAAYGEEPPSTINYNLLGSPKKVVTRIKGIWITAYHTRFELSAHPQVMSFLYDTGLGSKNSQGFGMFEVI